jgi:hypothetical protein
VSGRVDEVRHACGFGRSDHSLAIRANGHTFGLDADGYLSEMLSGGQIDNRHEAIVFVGDVDRFARRIREDENRRRRALEKELQDVKRELQAMLRLIKA